MDTRDVLVVDAFAPEPLSGTPVGVVPDGPDLAADQQARIASEVGVPVTAVVGRSAGPVPLTLAGTHGTRGTPHVALAVAAALDRRGARQAAALEFDLAGTTVEVTRAESGQSRVALDQPDLREAGVTAAEAAAAIGVDRATVRDVAADFPLVRASVGRGVLVVPVNFLEHLSGADPDPAAVADVLEASGAESLYAFTFDTLAGDRDAHGLELDAAGRRRLPTGEGEACAAAAIDRAGALDHDRDTLGFEAGHLLDRPARIDVTVGEGYAVGGPAVAAIDGSIAVPPPAESDDIIEV